MRKFIVTIEESTEEQDNLFLDYIKENEFNWWHWIKNFWIIIDYKDTINSLTLRDKVSEIYGSRNLVLEFEKKGWGGFGPNSDEPGGKNMFNWLNNIL